MKKLLAIITVLALAACSASNKSVVKNRAVYDILNDPAEIAEIDKYFCNKSLRVQKTHYPNQTKVHSLEECRLIIAYAVSDIKIKSVEDSIYKFTDKKYNADKQIRVNTTNNSAAMETFLMGVGAGLANQTTTNNTNRAMNCTTTSTGYLTSGLITNCYK